MAFCKQQRNVKNRQVSKLAKNASEKQEVLGRANMPTFPT
jgi:hypothetical protein